MRITVSLPERPDAWIAGLQRELPDAVVEAWRPGAAPADHAVVWAPSRRVTKIWSAPASASSGIDVRRKAAWPASPPW